MKSQTIEHPRTGLADGSAACEFLGIKSTKLNQLANAGHVTRVKLGRKASRYTWESLHSFIRKLESGQIELA